MLTRLIMRSRETVRAGIAALVEETGADELMVVSDVYDHQQRLRSFALIVQALKSVAPRAAGRTSIAGATQSTRRRARVFDAAIARAGS